MIFPEGIAQNGILAPSLPRFRDPQTAFTFHYYCTLTQMATSSSPADAACRPLEQHGIGSWSLADFVNAMKHGVRPDGAHLYPAFPYPSYQRMKIEDIIDLKAFLDTLPPVATDAPPHELPFPYNIRRGIGLWKLLYVDGKTFTPDPRASDQINRGAYLVTGPGHCGECHSPRNAFGGVIASRALSGGPAPEGKGHIPNITQADPVGIGSWSEEEIENMLETGFTPDFDSVGGAMAAVQRNLAKLSKDDLAAIAAYLKTVPPIDPAKTGS